MPKCMHQSIVERKLSVRVCVCLSGRQICSHQKAPSCLLTQTNFNGHAYNFLTGCFPRGLTDSAHLEHELHSFKQLAFGMCLPYLEETTHAIVAIVQLVLLCTTVGAPGVLLLALCRQFTRILIQTAFALCLCAELRAFFLSLFAKLREVSWRIMPLRIGSDLDCTGDRGQETCHLECLVHLSMF